MSFMESVEEETWKIAEVSIGHAEDLVMKEVVDGGGIAWRLTY